jgi:subtilisin family serine protease
MKKRLFWMLFTTVLCGLMVFGSAQKEKSDEWRAILNNLEPGVDYIQNEILISIGPHALAVGAAKGNVIRDLERIINKFGFKLHRVDYVGVTNRIRSRDTRICGGVIITARTSGDVIDVPFFAVEAAIRGVFSGLDDEIFVAPNDGLHMGQEIQSDPSTVPFELERQEGGLPSRDASGVKVAVLDSGALPIDGLQYDDENARDFSPDRSGSATSRDWQVDNIIQPSVSTPDVYGHGTPIVAVVARVARNATILPIKVCKGFQCTGRSVAQGICWASDHGARVINLSLGGFIASPVVHEAVRDAIRDRTVIVAAAGNSRTLRWPPNATSAHDWNAPVYPAAWSQGAAAFNVTTSQEDGIISVTAMATLSGDALPVWVSPFGHVGPTVDVMTYGEQIRTRYSLNRTFDGFETALRSGTSLATPIISGAAATLLARDPRFLPIHVKNAILSVAMRFPIKCYKMSIANPNARNGCVSSQDSSPVRPDTEATIRLLDLEALSRLMR